MQQHRLALEALSWVLSLLSETLDIQSKDILFTRAQPHKLLTTLRDHKIECEQSFAPQATALSNLGYNVSCDTGDRQYDLIFFLGTKHKLENLWNLGRLAHKLRENGKIFFTIENEYGAPSYKSKLKQVFSSFECESKAKSRVYILDAQHIANREVLTEWSLLDTETTRINKEYASHPASFSWDKIDPASKLLAESLPDNLRGDGADLGTGYGYLAKCCIDRSPDIQSLDLYEAEHYALRAAQQNLRTTSSTEVHFYWHDVTQGLLRRDYDWIVSNPPYHTGQQHSLSLFQSFIEQAAKSLQPSGQFFCVCQKQLPIEELTRRLFATCQVLAADSRFLVLQCQEPLQQSLQRPVA